MHTSQLSTTAISLFLIIPASAQSYAQASNISSRNNTILFPNTFLNGLLCYTSTTIFGNVFRPL